MLKRMQTSEIIFKLIAYLFLTAFSLMCLYPFVYAVSAALSGVDELGSGAVILWPVGLQFGAFEYVFKDQGFWVSYSNTLFVTFFGTLWAMIVAVPAAYALSKKRMPFRSALTFFFVFTLWFTAGLVPQYLNYRNTQIVFSFFGLGDDKWLVVIAMGMAAFNIVLLRNAFESVSKEIEEAAIIDGAKEFQLLTKVYIPMCKPTMATVTLFFAISRWNGYFWAMMMMRNPAEWPLQVYIRTMLEVTSDPDTNPIRSSVFASDSVIYSMIVCAIVPIIIIYPYIQKFFAKGVNLGGVKE